MEFTSYIGSTVVVTIALGGLFLLLRYILNVFGAQNSRSEAKDQKNVQVQQKQVKQPQQRDTEKAKSKKSQGARGGARTFQDKWLIATCKGHTGAVSDMNLSQNGKQLISCADDNSRERSTSETSIGGADGRRQAPLDDGSGSDSTKETSAEEDQSPRTSKPLSRRQKKNRKTQEPSSSSDGQQQNSHVQHVQQHVQHHQKKKQGGRIKAEKKSISSSGPLGLYAKISNVGDETTVLYLGSYVLSNEQRLNWGYPVVLGEGVFVFKADAEVRRRQPKTTFDVNAREFFPPTYSRDSDSGNSSESSSSDGCKPPVQMLYRGEVYYINQDAKENNNLQENFGRKTCCRCSRFFYMTDDFEYVSKERCRYHHGKLAMNYKHYSYAYTCCSGGEDSEGCTISELHVWSGMSAGFNGPFHDFVHTKPRRGDSPVRAYALDCEMSFTRFGLDVTKVTVVGLDGGLVYDAMVLPEAAVIDYNTRYSGITEADLRGPGVKRLKDVQDDLLKFIFDDTVLVGHGLENDLRALRIVHPTVIDTAIAYPHYNGLPFRRSLKQLTACFLKREIQTGNVGHSSFEDARAAMELIIYKYMMEFRNLLNFSL